MFGRKEDFSRAELLLLSKYLKPKSPKHYSDWDTWKDVLGRSSDRVINEFIKKNLLERPDLPNLLDGAFKVPELTKILKGLGLPVSGRKAELIERLISHDRSLATELVKDVDLLMCSEQGKEKAEQYLQSENRRRIDTNERIIQDIKSGNYKDAVMLYADFNAQEVFSPGIGVDWDDYDPSPDVQEMEFIAKDFPSILKDIDPTKIEKLRIAALMQGLIIGGYKYLPQEYKEIEVDELRFDLKTAIRMILFHAHYLYNIAEFHDLKVELVQLRSANDEHICESCRRIEDKIFQLSEVPEIPYPKCTSEMGCRCGIEIEKYAWD